MRLSLLKHPLAVLRITLKLTQKEMADICEVSWSTIQAIEHGILRMSEAVAERLSIKADVSIDWLLKGDPEAPMVSQNGEPYTKRHFEEAQAALFAPKETKGRVVGEYYAMPEVLGTAFLKLYAIMRKGYRQNRFAWITYKVHKAIDDLAADTGIDETFGEEVKKVDFSGESTENFMKAINLIVRTHNADLWKRGEKFLKKKPKSAKAKKRK
jgi:DNA-binding XRE family transcriptional regulator